MRARLGPFLPLALALASALGAACHGSGPEPANVAPAQSLSLAASSKSAPAPRASSPRIDLAKMTDKEACGLPVEGQAQHVLQHDAPTALPEPQCPAGNPFCDSVESPPAGADACFVANENIRRAEAKSRAPAPRAAGTSAPPPRPADVSAAWDGVKKPKYLDRIDAHFHLTKAEQGLLRRNGFVVLDRVAYTDYASAFHDVFQEELPLYVGIDPILHAVFRGTESVLERVEQKKLAPALRSLLRKMRGTLARSRGVYDETTLADLDLHLAVAASLAGEEPGRDGGHSLFGQEEAVRAVLAAVGNKTLEPIELFGRPRVVDFSQLEPRGHYSAFNPEAKWSPSAYFQAVMWLSRLEYNLVSRSSRSSHPDASPDPRETPREARDALALADLVQRAGALSELAAFEEVYGAFAGRREDVSIPELLRIMQKEGIRPNDPAAPEKLKTAIGDGYERTARTHFTPENAPELPAIATLLGPRIVPDIAPLTRLVHDRVPGRHRLGAADVAHLLGHDRANHWLAADLKQFAPLGAELGAARRQLASQAERGKDVQASWLRAIVALSRDPEGVRPSFMSRDAYADSRMNSALVAYGQLRHTFVLLAGQGYDSYGCEIPDAYLEPLAPAYDALLAHVEGLRKAAGGGFAGLERTLRTLRAIAGTELGSGAPTEAQRTWLAMVAEYLPKGGYSGDSGEPPKWTGWYFDMFENREIGATVASAFVADYFTLTNRQEVAYLGAEGPRLGVFVVDTGGEPRAMVGPVARGYEVHAPITGRLDDKSALTNPNRQAAWREGFAAPEPPVPPLDVQGRMFHCKRAGGLEARLVLASDKDLGSVAVTLLDHHADPLAPPLGREAHAGLTVFRFYLPNAGFEDLPFGGTRLRTPVEAMHVRIHDLEQSGAGQGPYDYTTSPSVFTGKDFETEGLPARPRGVEAFVIGRAAR
ncbi:DUF3160 domain-containing protein [Polyangium aurulentum]|uniref:DUF3160 domain-containing protein n=1 Tax=Polyangium aurulentum TaxID=2567896 RepID=UPI0010AE294E|nr:DUF3160 domain-containing protein [Polyangium aurulentum]UQA59720.1 DUF3160 domain-containing protein [Polyangium aurulentum]